MSTSAQKPLPVENFRVGSNRQTSAHVVFVDPTAEDAERRLQEVLLLKPSFTFDVHHLQPEDIVGQISKVLERCKSKSIRSFWTITGKEVAGLSEPQVAGGNIKLDKRISNWQEFLAHGATCYLLGDESQELGEQITRQTTAPVRYDFDASAPVVFDEVIFVDHSILNFEPLVKEILLERDAEIVSLDSDSDGIFLIADYVSKRKNLKAIHLVCPGAEGILNIGRGLLSCESLANEYRDVLKIIGRALASDGDIRIYNRKFNSGFAGAQVVKELSSITGAFIIVANSPATDWIVEPELLKRFSSVSSLPSETGDWTRPFPPLALTGLEINHCQSGVSTGHAPFNELPEPNEFVIKFEFDRVQALGWLCVGFATGFAALVLLTSFGFWS